MHTVKWFQVLWSNISNSIHQVFLFNLYISSHTVILFNHLFLQGFKIVSRRAISSAIDLQLPPSIRYRWSGIFQKWRLESTVGIKYRCLVWLAEWPDRACPIERLAEQWPQWRVANDMTTKAIESLSSQLSGFRHQASRIATHGERIVSLGWELGLTFLQRCGQRFLQAQLKGLLSFLWVYLSDIFFFVSVFLFLYFFFSLFLFLSPLCVLYTWVLPLEGFAPHFLFSLKLSESLNQVFSFSLAFFWLDSSVPLSIFVLRTHSLS